MVVKRIKQLKHNGIPAEFHKGTGRLISFPLSLIVNVSVQSSDLRSA